MTPIDLVLAIALPDSTWHTEAMTLWWGAGPAPDRATLEREAIAAWSATYPRSEAVHVWLYASALGHDESWPEDDGIAEDRRRKGALAEDDLPL